MSSINGPQPSECSQTLTAGEASPDFTCVSGSSNPATDLTWYLNESEQVNTHQPQSGSGEYNGSITTLPFNLGRLQKSHNGNKLQCKGTVQGLNCGNMMGPVCTLNVQCKYTLIGRLRIVVEVVAL